MFIFFSCNGQENKSNEFTYEDFNNEILKYKPLKKSGVTEKDFNKGLFRLNETKTAVNNDPENFTYADYWNIAMAFVNLDESDKSIRIAFEKAIELDAEKVCQIIKIFGYSQLDIRIPDTFYTFLKNCKDFNSNEALNLEEYANSNGLKLELVTAIHRIQQADMKFRYNSEMDASKQTILDKQNQRKIDSLYNYFNTYIGKSLVGEKFQNTMWAVIQHSNVEMMEKYLPVIQEAVKNGELKVVPFKMLIDRYYGLKYGYQIFGTQDGFGFDLANEKKRKEIALKHGIHQ
jgi:hypothetical protein